MKKLLFVFSILALCACENVMMQDDISDDEENGNLSVSVFQIENTPFASFTRTAVADVCTRLNYAVYSADGTRIKQVNQTVDDANFGTTSFQLDEGTYLLVIVAHSSGGNPTMADPTCIKFTNSQGFSDTFFCCGEVTIGDEPVDIQATLSRIVALCRFVVTDDIPADVKKMRFYYTGGSGAFDALTGLGCVNSKQDVKFDVTAGQKQFDLYTFLHDIEGTIHLKVTALDGNDTERYSSEFDVSLYQNQITWLSGAYFSGGGSSSSGVTEITVNADWAGEHYITF